MSKERQSRAKFAETRWSLVSRARLGDAEGKRALEDLCALYWPPVYAFFRQDGMREDAARDLTQGLFLDLLERGDIGGGDPGKGRFRSYLLACARHYRSNAADRQRAQKRGGDVVHLPIAWDRIDEEPNPQIEGVVLEDQRTPEDAFAQAWVRELLVRSLSRLKEAEAAKGNAELFAKLRVYLEGDGSGKSYAELAEEAQLSEGAIKVAVHRLRRRFRETLLEELGHTVEDKIEAEAELKDLFRCSRK